MFDADDIRDWRSHDVVDEDGAKIASAGGDGGTGSPRPTCG